MAKKVIRDAAGRPFSKWKPAEKFAYIMERDQPDVFAACQMEVEFDVDRKWRFDFAWIVSHKIAVEIDGFGYGHQAQQMMAGDNEKANRAVMLGWRVLRYNSRQLGSMAGVVEAVEQTAELVICGPTSATHS